MTMTRLLQRQMWWVAVLGTGLLAALAAKQVVAFAGRPAVGETLQPGLPAEMAIRAAVLERVGSNAEVTVLKVDPINPRAANISVTAAYRDARPDPAGVLGKPIRFTLIPETGAAVPVVVTLSVVAEYALARRAIGRSHTIAAEDLESVRGAVSGIPMRLMSTVEMLAGARALRPIAAGEIVQTSFVAARRAVEPGHPVTVVAISGDVQVSAKFIAADGGPVGATIRVLNPETKRLIRGRIVGEGLVEVVYGR